MKTHTEHAKSKNLTRPCTANDLNFGGECFNCGWVPEQKPVTSYTPGPWKKDTRILDKNVLQTISGGGRWIATLHRDSATTATQVYPSEAEAEANARLIAAAPDLLEAAKLGLAAMIAWGGRCEAAGEDILARDSVLKCEIIRASIAKAEGNS